MKRNLSLWLGLLAFALMPVLAQAPATPANPVIKGPSGKIHGHVTNDAGVTQTTGTVSLSTDGGPNTKFSFPVDASGNYSGEAAQGTYTLVYRTPGMPPEKLVDKIEKVKIVAGQDVLQDIDMTRKEFLDQLSTEDKKALEEYKKKHAEVAKTNEIVNNINADLKIVAQDFKDADGALAAAKQALGATAAKADVDAREAEIKTAKYTEAETLMLKDTAAKADASVLWAQLGQAQVGLANTKSDQTKFGEAEASFKKAIEVDLAAKKPAPVTQGAAYSGLGEIYARAGKVPEANAAYDSAAKAYPQGAWNNLKNEAVIFIQVGNGDAAAAAADEAIKVDPSQALPYYLKGQGLIQKATIDPATSKMVLPPGCAEAYQKYLDLAPTGPYANDVKGILAEATQTHNSSIGIQKPRKGK
jgi:hypothetical protein